jgi:hypothetical protein
VAEDDEEQFVEWVVELGFCAAEVVPGGCDEQGCVLLQLTVVVGGDLCEEGVFEQVAIGEAVVEFGFGDVGNVLGDGFAFLQRGHAGINIKLNHLNNLFLLRKCMPNQPHKPVLRIIIKFRRYLQHQQHQIKRIKLLIREIKFKNLPDIGNDWLDEVELDHPCDEHLVHLVSGDELLVEVLVLCRVILTLVVGYLYLLHFAHCCVHFLNVHGEDVTRWQVLDDIVQLVHFGKCVGFGDRELHALPRCR